VTEQEPEWFERLLELQLRANPAIWQNMKRLGVSEDTLLRLAFIYLAPGEEAASVLVRFLAQETDYEVQARERAAGASGPGEWLVIGATQPVAVSLETIDAWVEWMVAAGASEGPCAFDGWTSEIVGELPDDADE
jgi:sarcosine oxidase gamma subunit